MKKIFSILAVALVAFSFASCDKKDGPTPTTKDFTIEVADITATGAHVTVTPSDTTAFYFISYVSQEDLDYYEMTIDQYAADDMEWYPNNGYKFADMAQQGVAKLSLDGYLQPEKVYYVYAFKFNKSWEILSEIAQVKFTTPKLEIKETVNVTAEGTVYDMTDGYYLLGIEANMDATGNSYLTLAFLTENAEGTFTEEDIDTYYGMGAWVVVDYAKEEYYQVITLNATGAYNADSTSYSFNGELVAANSVKYVLNLTCVPQADEEEEGGDEMLAPAKAKKVIEKSYLGAKHAAKFFNK